MSLYTKLFGENPDANALIGALGLNKSIFERYRDIFLNKEGTEIIVYTRCGGPNRTEYERVFEIMKKHPNYICDYDDEFDNTYAYIKFSVPEKYKFMCKSIAPKENPRSVDQMFKDHIEKAKDPNSEEAKKDEEIMNAILDQIIESEANDPDTPGVRFINL